MEVKGCFAVIANHARGVVKLVPLDYDGGPVAYLFSPEEAEDMACGMLKAVVRLKERNGVPNEGS